MCIHVCTVNWCFYKESWMSVILKVISQGVYLTYSSPSLPLEKMVLVNVQWIILIIIISLREMEEYVLSVFLFHNSQFNWTGFFCLFGFNPYTSNVSLTFSFHCKPNTVHFRSHIYLLNTIVLRLRSLKMFVSIINNGNK